MLGLSSSLVKGGASLLTFVKDNLKLYLDFKSNKSDTLKFPSEGSTYFNANDQGVNTGNIFSGGETQASFAFWIYADETDTGVNKIVGQTNETSNMPDPFAVFWNNTNNSIRGYYADGTASNFKFVDSNATTANEWHHVVVTFDLSTATIKIYIDGVDETGSGVVVIGTPPTSVASNTTTNLIGVGRATVGGDALKGYLTNVAIWSRVLTQEEAQSIQNKSYSQLKGVEKTSLVAWWALDSQSDGLVQPATGEELGAEKITSNTTSNWSDFVSNGTEPVKTNTANGVSLRSQGDSRAAYYTISGLTNGSLYKVVFNSRTDIVDGNAKIYFNASSTYFSSGISTTDTQYTIYGIAGSSNSLNIFGLDTGTTIFVENFSVKEVTSNTGVVTGATTTTSVYGGNAPILPRAVDVAKEGQADAIGNGSASFNGTSDYIDAGSDSSVDDIWTGGGTFTGWININSAGENNGGMFIVKRGSDSGGYISTKDPSGNTCKLRLAARWDNWAQWTTTSRDLTYNEWIHIAVSYDNGSTSNNPTMYINGVSVDVTTVTTPSGTYESNASDDLYIGGEAGAFTTDGFISQVGLWRGELTQAQIQSVMESTSYSKIPADVKSTLSAELVQDSDWGEGIGWEDTGDNTWTYTSGTTSSLSIQNFSNLTIGKLYKVQYTITSNSNNIVLKWGGTNFFDANTAISSTVGTYIYYGVATTNNFVFRRLSGTGTIGLSNPSLKEVTNDIVAYYPLDASKHQAPSGIPVFGAVEDVTTGENLGSELFTGFTNTDCATFNYNSSTKELTATCDSSNQEVHASINLENGKIYRVEFTTGANYSNPVLLKGFKDTIHLENNASSPDFNRGYFGANNTYVFYTRATATGTRYIGFRGSSGHTIHITNFSVKKANSNMGLLL